MAKTKQPESLMLFIKTNKDFHQGGFVFSNLNEYTAAEEAVRREVGHVVEIAQGPDPAVELESWGLINPANGEVFKEFTSV